MSHELSIELAKECIHKIPIKKNCIKCLKWYIKYCKKEIAKTEKKLQKVNKVE